MLGLEQSKFSSFLHCAIWDKILCTENIVLTIDAHASGESTEVLQNPLGFCS